MSGLVFEKKVLPYLLILPVIIVLVFVFAYPLIMNLWISFNSWGITGREHFVGIRNYLKMFSDQIFMKSLGNTFLIVVIALPVEFILGYILAEFLMKIKKRNIWVTLLMLPMMLCPVVTGVAWRTMFNYEFGIVNYFLSLLGVKPQLWVGNAGLAILSVLIVEIWSQTPFFMLVLSAGLDSLSPEPLEAALIDGASSWQRIRFIKLPLLRPVILVTMIFRSVALISLFDVIYSLTGGGPGSSTYTVSFKVYSEAFYSWRYGYGAAIANLLLVLSLIIGFFFIRSMKLETY